MEPTDVKSLFSQSNLQQIDLNGCFDAITPNEFVEQFRKIFNQDLAQSTVKVVYIWYTEKPIPRLSGQSNIIYIGKTNQSLSLRHTKYAQVEGRDLNWKRYENIIKNFGPIRVSYAECDNPLQYEKSFLVKYFKCHLELPPLNSKI